MKKQKGFTLIELLVVIAIIGLLSTLAVVALNNARQKSRDAKRVSDIKQVQTALELYYNDANSYPAALTPVTGSITYDGTTYMAVVPGNPSPKNDGSCPDIEYAYTQDSSGSSYHITYCLGGATGGITAGTKYATPAGIAN
ncbi:MAG: type II secretion system protein [Patescibacteria group bacterium]|jgi:general secretion pathway protein G